MNEAPALAVLLLRMGKSWVDPSRLPAVLTLRPVPRRSIPQAYCALELGGLQAQPPWRPDYQCQGGDREVAPPLHNRGKQLRRDALTSHPGCLHQRHWRFRDLSLSGSPSRESLSRVLQPCRHSTFCFPRSVKLTVTQSCSFQCIFNIAFPSPSL